MFCQTKNIDTLKVISKSKFGEITFTKYCKNDKLEFVQSKNPIINKEVENEAWERNIKKDKFKLKFHINKEGKISSWQLIGKAKLKSLNSFIPILWNDVIENLDYTENSLKCGDIERDYYMPVVYKRQNKK